MQWQTGIPGTVTIPAHITTQSHTFKSEEVRGVGGHTPPRKFGFLRPCVHFRVFKGHKNGITIALKVCQWALAVA